MPRAADRDVDDALHLCAGPGCVLCGADRDGVDAWLRAFVGEARADDAAVEGVRGALGFCPAHTRRLLADAAATWVLPALVREVVAEGRERLAGGLAGRRPAAVATCPACVAAARSTQSAAGLLAGTLADGRVAGAFADAGGVCATHLDDLVAAARGDAGAVHRVAAGVLDHRLAEPGAALAATTGDDPDAARRAPLLPRLADLAAQDDAAAAAGGGRSRARLVLGRPTCPPCTAAAVTARRYVAWVAGSAPGRGESPTRQDDVLCATHLRDAADIGGPRVDQLLAAAARAARDAAGAAPARRRRARPAPGLGCRACSAATTAEDRAWDLLDAVAADAPLTALARTSHGVCLRHGLRRAAGHGPAGQLFGETLDGRLAVLAWDLAEARRQERWDTRFEPVGASSTAWRRATTVLDGRIDLGTAVP